MSSKVYFATLSRYAIRRAGDNGWALVDRRQRIARGWFQEYLQAADARLTMAENAVLAECRRRDG